jgi:F0F1-type ATP synthase delta subunit
MILAVIFLQIVVFGIVIYVLRKIMVGNTESAVNRLNQSYAEITKKKEDLTKKIHQIEEECSRQRQAVQEEVKKMREDAEKELNEKKDKIIGDARKKAEETINDALEAKSKIEVDIRKKEQMKMISYCEELVKTTISNFIQEKINDLFVEKILEDIKEVDPQHIPFEVDKIDLLSAKELNSKLFSTIKKVITEKLKREVSFKQIVDKKLVLGIVVKFGSLVLDESLAAKLQNQSILMKTAIEKT